MTIFKNSLNVSQTLNPGNTGSVASFRDQNETFCIGKTKNIFVVTFFCLSNIIRNDSFQFSFNFNYKKKTPLRFKHSLQKTQ
jgi:hypothetical protein